MYRYFFVLHSIVLNNLNKKKNCWSSYQHWPCSAILIHGGWSWSSRQGNICHRYSCFPIHQLYQSLHLQKYILFLLEKDILSHWEWIFFPGRMCCESSWLICLGKYSCIYCALIFCKHPGFYLTISVKLFLIKDYNCLYMYYWYMY